MKRTRMLAVAVGAVLLLALAVLAGYLLGQRPAAPRPDLSRASPATNSGAPAGTATKPAPERPVLYWYDPMYPDKRFDKPGKSPFMDMMLVPRYADEAQTSGHGDATGGTDGQAAASVRIDSGLAQNLGVRLARAERGALPRAVDTVGSVQADDTRRVSVQSRAAGWLESLQVRAVDERVRRGQVLARIYSPELLAAQEEYLLLASRTASEDDRALLAAALQRLSLLGLSPAQITALQRDGRAQRAIAVHAPASGIVSELGAREGAQVSPGMTLFSLLDLSVVWVIAEVPERQIADVSLGAKVQATLSAFPGETFSGTVDYIYPGVNSETRTVRVRSSLRNAAWKLKPGMVARVRLEQSSAPERVLVPAEALIRTGQRTVVILVQEGGGFRPSEVEVGVERDGKAEVLSGLEPGQQVVVSGQFLIDSEANLRAAVGRLQGAPEGAPPSQGPAAPPKDSAASSKDSASSSKDSASSSERAAASSRNSAASSPSAANSPASGIHYAQGVIQSVDRDKAQITITHGPFETLQMPAMTMAFAAAAPEMMSAAIPGSHVRFGIRRDDKGRFVIVDMGPVAAGTARGARP